MSEVGPQIRRLRKAKGWTVAQLAVYAGMSPSAVSQIETGRRSPTAASMSKLAAALEVEVAALFPLAQTPLPDPAQERRAPVLDGPFVWDPVKGEEVEARRVKSYRPWT